MSEQAAQARGNAEQLTRRLAEQAASMHETRMPPQASAVAGHCLLDWLGVTLAGAAEPAARHVVEQIREDGGHPRASVLGSGFRASLTQAALANGTSSHALDFDDVHLTLMGHPSVPVMPAVLALAEQHHLDGPTVIAAIVAGIETECRIGLAVSPGHYHRGWHATGTVGTFGAAAAAARALGLDADRTAVALGLAGTQAAGLKSMFGTMAKPLHAGKAAANGLYAAQLAARGFVARPDGVECVQGFGEAYGEGGALERALEGLGQQFYTPDTLFKYHAACYGTHASIEAGRVLRERVGRQAGDLSEIEIRVPPENLRMCDIERPRTGLEAKFSLRMTAAMALSGVPTGAIERYDEALCADPALVGLSARMRTVGDAQIPRMQAVVTATGADGVVHREHGNVERPERDLDRQSARVAEKFTALAAPILGARESASIVEVLLDLRAVEDVGAVVRRVADAACEASVAA